jgi:glutamine synthetase
MADTTLFGARTPEDVLELCRANGIQMVDVRFTDVPGGWQHFTVPAGELTADVFAEGLGFDGSSIRGFKQIHESDMLLKLDPTTAFVDPVLRVPTLAIIGDVYDPISGAAYERDPRRIARRAEAYLQQTRVATVSYWGPEAEFYIFNSLRFDQTSHSGYYHIDSEEGIWNSGREGANGAYRPRYKEGYFPVPPTDKLQDLRSEIVLALQAAGVRVEVQHHEVGTAGQAEIDMRYDTLVNMADKVMKYKYIVKNVCAKNGYVATFMPKPLFGDNGSGMHVHQSLWMQEKPLFADESGYAGLSEMARHYIGGLLRHAPALLALAAPTTNSYRRLVPGFEAPINLVYSQRNRSACVRIPMYSRNPKTKRIEFRAPDPSCNPYLAFSALLLAGLDGVLNRIEPPAPVDEDIYELDAAARAGIRSTPGSLEDVLTALEADHEFLLAGEVFSQDFIASWIAYKRENDLPAVRMRPHPYEFFLYSDV